MAAALAVTVAAVVLLSTRDDPDDGGVVATTATTSTVGPDRPSATTTDSPTAAGATPGDPGTVVPVEPVQGNGEAELCAGIVERLRAYRVAAAASPVPDQALIEQLTEFQAQVDTQADDQDWGDRITEDLTDVRREWATALAAANRGDDAEADERGEAAIEDIDRAIGRAGCPGP